MFHSNGPLHHTVHIFTWGRQDVWDFTRGRLQGFYSLKKKIFGCPENHTFSPLFTVSHACAAFKLCAKTAAWLRFLPRRQQKQGAPRMLTRHFSEVTKGWFQIDVCRNSCNLMPVMEIKHGVFPHFWVSFGRRHKLLLGINAINTKKTTSQVVFNITQNPILAAPAATGSIILVPPLGMILVKAFQAGVKMSLNELQQNFLSEKKKKILECDYKTYSKEIWSFYLMWLDHIFIQ